MRNRASGWGAAVDRVRWLGPGFVMAATAIGASHLVLAPTAGAAFGYALLWVMPFAHLFKYPAFEFGPRFAVATGTSLLHGYARVPGPRNWGLWLFLAGTIVQGVTVLAGVLGVAASVAAVALPFASIPLLSLVLGVLVAWLLRSGGFSGLAGLSKWMLLVLAVMTLFAFLARPPGAGFLAGLAVPVVPDASIVLLAAIVGWMPTGIDVSVWHSMWALERRKEWTRRAEESGRVGSKRAAAFALGRLDMQLGYGLSLVLAVFFVALGAEVLRPAGLIPQGADVAIALARLYTETLGAWVLPLLLVAAFFGMFSTAYGVMDGFPRAFSQTVSLLRGSRDKAEEGRDPGDDAGLGGDGEASFDPRRSRLYWGFLTCSLVLALLETLWIPDPVLLVTIAAVASFLIAPVLYVLNHYCATRLIPEPDLRPGRILQLWSIVGIACMAAATALFLYVRLRGS